MITDRYQELWSVQGVGGDGGVGGGTGLTSAVIIVISLDRLVIRARTWTKPGLSERKNSRGRYRKTYRPTAYVTTAFDIKKILMNVRSAKDTQVLSEAC